MSTSHQDLAGSWVGTNAFRLMPADPPYDAPATASVTGAAGGHLMTLAYTWTHPVDGPQDGLLVLGLDEGGPALAFWGDSWHQSPEPRTLSGSVVGGVWTLGYDYVPDEWRWSVVVDATDARVLRLQMENIDLAEAEPAYAAMVMVLRRTPDREKVSPRRGSS